MNISLKEVEHVALLARLEITESEKEAYTRQLNDILRYMEKINSLDTTDVEPTAHVLPIVNVFREDIDCPGLKREQAMQNAPDEQDGQFKVPKIV
ncbi:MAG: Asp-tRNA(Asn)/Glu-tRNA(Gln) amidotransferase subunit GatC [Bacillota bacterium]